ncbi:MAG TPA: toll/interleukin-1 receptor domain-containing protein, partial [Lentzea sp.]
PEATGLYDRLVADHFGGHRVFLDRVSLPLGHDFRPRLTDVLRRCDLALVVIGPRWPELLRDREGTEDYVLVEVETALSLGIPVVPVLVGGAGLPATGDLPASIAVLPHLQSVALRDGTDFADDCASLAARLEELQKQHIRDSVKRVPQLRRTHRLGVAAFVLALVGPLIWTAVDDATYPSRALTGAQVSPDGRRVATAVEGELRTWDVERAAWSEVVGELDGPADVIRWSPDGRWLATGDGYTGAMRLWDAASMRVVRPLSGHQGLLDDIAWSPDSTRIATGDGDGVVRVWRIDAELPLVGKAVFSGLNPHVSVVAWAPGGPNTLAVGGWEPTVRLLRLQDGELRETDVFTGHRSFVGRVRWSPDGRRLVSADLELGLVFHGVADGRFTSSTDLGFQRGWNSIDDLGWSPDGAWLAVADGTKDVVRLWSAETGQAAPPLAVHPVGQIEASLAWSPDGKRVAVSNNTAVRVLSVPDGRLLAGTDHGQAEVAGEEVRLAGWSGVGDRIVWTSGRRVRITLFGVGTGERTELRPTSLAGWLLGG